MADRRNNTYQSDGFTWCSRILTKTYLNLRRQHEKKKSIPVLIKINPKRNNSIVLHATILARSRISRSLSLFLSPLPLFLSLAIRSMFIARVNWYTVVKYLEFVVETNPVAIVGIQSIQFDAVHIAVPLHRFWWQKKFDGIFSHSRIFWILVYDMRLFVYLLGFSSCFCFHPFSVFVHHFAVSIVIGSTSNKSDSKQTYWTLFDGK